MSKAPPQHGRPRKGGPTYPHVEAANRYARGVASGDISACRLTALACRRHLDDSGRGKDFPYRFDSEKAERVCRFIELMPHTKGKWALEQSRLKLEPWQAWIVCCLFGWVRKDNGRRRFRKAYIEVPRKNGKSALAAALGLYMLAADGEYGAEVYSGATTEKQAWEVFRPAKIMAERTSAYRQKFGVEVNASNIHILANGSRFEPVIGKPGDGSSPSFAIVDEYHEHQTDDLIETMETGMGAREQPMLFAITTAGSNTAGPCYAQRHDSILMLEGRIPQDDLFAVIYGVDEGDDWTTEEALRKANPNYDVSVSADWLAARQKEAMSSSRKQNVFKTKHLNTWVGARSGYFNMEDWNNLADPDLALEDFDGEDCWIGLDLASKIDVAAHVKLFKREIGAKDHWYVFGRFYLPKERISNPDCRHYQGWAHDGRLIATDGNVIDEPLIEADLVNDAARFQVVSIGYDPWGARSLAQRLQDQHGIPVKEVQQTTRSLSDPMKWVAALIEDGRLHHDGCPVLAWMMGNVTAKEDANENVFPRKERLENKIDGAVALIIAMAVAMQGGPPTRTEDLWVLSC